MYTQYSTHTGRQDHALQLKPDSAVQLETGAEGTLLRANRVAAFDVTGCKIPSIPSVLFARLHARQESSKFYSDLRNASSLELTKCYCVNCHCSTVAMSIKLSSYATWSTSEAVGSLNSFHVFLPCGTT